MCPLCWAVISTNILFAFAGVFLANLTDLKFGLWLSIAIVAQVLWNNYAVTTGGEALVIPPALLTMQIALGASRGARLLEGEHWLKRLAVLVGVGIGRALARIVDTIRPARAATLQMPKGFAKSLAAVCTWIIGPVLAGIVDRWMGAPMFIIGAFLMGLRLEPITIGESWTTPSVALWIPLLLGIMVYARGALLLAHRHDHWMRRFHADIVLGRKGTWHEKQSPA